MKRGQFNFSWLFALIVGAAILFLAIYGAMRIADTSRFQADTEVAKKIEILTDPLQAGFAEGSYGKIEFQSETRVNNICLDGDFGKNDVSVSTRSRIGEEWNLAGGAISIHNKYLFSKEATQGEEFYVFSKPFELPYKISDLTIMMTGQYCFVGAPVEIEEEISGLNIPNIKTENCTGEETRVCFGSSCNGDVTVIGTCVSGCDSIFEEGYVEMGSRKNYFVGNLMYAAIFSDSEVYDCNVQRLMYRGASIAEVLGKKAELMDSRGCDTRLRGDLIVYGGTMINASQNNLGQLRAFTKQMEVKNENEMCGLW